MLINNPGKRKHRCNDLKMSVHLSYSLENVEREVSIVGKKREKELAKQVQGYTGSWCAAGEVTHRVSMPNGRALDCWSNEIGNDHLWAENDSRIQRTAFLMHWEETRRRARTRWWFRRLLPLHMKPIKIFARGVETVEFGVYFKGKTNRICWRIKYADIRGRQK